METNKNIYLLIPAAGTGLRMGSPVPKQYQKIEGKAILRHTLDLFIEMGVFTEICVIISPDHEIPYQDAVAGLNICPPAYGGDTRKESVHNGLSSFSNIRDNDIILIHDAARPLVTPNDVKTLLNVMETEVAATLAIPVSDTLKKENGETIDRDSLWSVQTPQAFRFDILKEAHAKGEDNVTDDTALVSALGHTVKFVKSSPRNFKITTREDWCLAKEIMESKTARIRTAMGFDVHAFDSDDRDVTHIRLCGIDIPYTKKLKGHSDADVALHAITDALLGTISAGDIGDHFPPTDHRFKNMNSSLFLMAAYDKLIENNAVIENIDVTLICEKPKIGSFKDQMRERVASLLSIQTCQVSVKATTTEQLGFTGREEGIAAQAIATIRITE